MRFRWWVKLPCLCTGCCADSPRSSLLRPHDGNRLRIISPTITSIEFEIQYPVASWDTILSNLRDFLLDNCTKDRCRALRNINISVDRSLLKLQRRAGKEASALPQDHTLYDHRGIEESDETAIVALQKDYGRMVSALRRLDSSRSTELIRLEAEWNVKIDIIDIVRALAEEER